MSEAVTMGHLPSSLHAVREFATCGGQAVVISQRSNRSASLGSQSVGGVGLALAAVLAEREAEGHRDDTVILRVGSQSAAWIGEAISWLSAHGRRVEVRTGRVLPATAIASAREHGALIVLEIASFDEEVQRALLGAGADGSARLLLQAQHLRALHIPVAVQVAPVLPMLHTTETLAALCRHIAAADLRDVSFALGRWSAKTQAALETAVPGSMVTGVARAFGVFDTVDGASRIALAHHEAAALYGLARRVAQGIGLRVGGCGCQARCQLAPAPAQPFRSLLASDLFAGVG